MNRLSELLAAAFLCLAASAASAQVRPFPLSDVELLEGRARQNMRLDSAWLASIPINRLMHSFQVNAGVASGREGGYMTVRKYGGWESLDCELRGHTCGHFLSACSLMYLATGEESFRHKGDSAVAVLATCQEALGSGYISAFPEELINRNIRGTGVWAPWYTLHKILAGLLDFNEATGSREALGVAAGLADWAYAKLSPIDSTTRTVMLRNEFGGINEAFWNLYGISGDPRHRWLADFFHHEAVLDPLKEHDGDFGTKHTNTFIPKVIGEIRKYELTGDGQSRNLAEFFWNEVVSHHCYATGSVSDKEHFFPLTDFSEHITGYSGETCCTYNMLKLSRHLFCLCPSAAIGDYYERALLNHIMGQQDPETGMVSYFLPLAPGTHKVYSTKENSFWCCVGSGFESHAKYAECVYFHDDRDLWVNLYMPTALNWEEKGFRLVQKTEFPYGTKISIRIEAENAREFCIRFRWPSWCSSPTVSVNGKRQKLSGVPGSFIVLERKWKNGDRIELELPMNLHLEYVPGRTDMAALMYGPVVLAGEFGTEGMASAFSDPSRYNDYYTYDYRIPSGFPSSLRVLGGDPSAGIVPVEGGRLEFRSSEGYLLRPVFDIHRQRHTVYWNIEKTRNPGE
ncbi:MAG: glycoside hydrolase family 127 protein [Bacteroidales bacterium]|nr:glycoside hydrolase family 127 protein [Bacteroidales bacterium]